MTDKPIVYQMYSTFYTVHSTYLLSKKGINAKIRILKMLPTNREIYLGNSPINNPNLDQIDQKVI